MKVMPSSGETADDQIDANRAAVEIPRMLVLTRALIMTTALQRKTQLFG